MISFDASDDKNIYTTRINNIILARCIASYNENAQPDCQIQGFEQIARSDLEKDVSV